VLTVKVQGKVVEAEVRVSVGVEVTVRVVEELVVG